MKTYINVSKLNNRFTTFIMAVIPKVEFNSQLRQKLGDFNDTSLYDHDQEMVEFPSIQKAIEYAKISARNKEEVIDFLDYLKQNEKFALYYIRLDNFNFERFQKLQNISEHNEIKVLQLN